MVKAQICTVDGKPIPVLGGKVLSGKSQPADLPLLQVAKVRLNMT